MPTILSICGDPGGAAALAPVLAALNKIESFKTVNFAYGHAKSILEKRNVSCRLLGDQTQRSEITHYFDEERPDALLTGTSLNGINLELPFIDEARDRRIYSLSIMDFWSNYRVRFEDVDKAIHLPDEIAVMDEFAVQEMQKEGFEKSTLVVTGQPALDDLVRITDREKAVQTLGRKIRIDSRIVAFISQPPADEWGTDEQHPKYPGFSKFTVLPMLIEALEQISENITLVIRPHPRESEDDFSWAKSSKIKVVVYREGDSREFVQACDLVTGMNSVLLLEASLLGCLVLSLQPNARFDDCLPSNRMQLSGSIRNPDELQKTLQAFLLDETTRNTYRARCDSAALPMGAVNRVVAHLCTQLS